MVRLFAYWREPLRTALQTNPACRRLAPLPDPLVRAVEGVPSYDDLRTAAADGELTKFFDVNLTQLFTGTPIRDTIEIRILPGAIENERGDRLLNERAGRMGVSYEEAKQYRLGFVSMRTRMRPQDLAEMALFLASAKAERISGQAIAVDGNVEWED